MNSPSFTQLARRDVDTFVDGLYGGMPLPIDVRLSFPKSDAARDYISKIVARVYFHMDIRSAVVMPWPQRCRIVFKVAAHMLRVGPFTTEALISTYDTLECAARMMAERPSYITDPINISTMAMIYRQIQLNRSRAASFSRPQFVLPRPAVWRSTDGYIVLSELVDPWHLIDEGEMVGHCIGTLFTDGIKHPKPSDLLYWRWICEGRSHVFSLELGQVPVCTFHVGAMEQKLLGVEGRHGKDVLRFVERNAVVIALRLLKELFPQLEPSPTLDPAVLRTLSCHL